MKCVCRTCKKVYDDQKATADYTGYCTQRCMKAKAKEYGWSERNERDAKARGWPYAAVTLYGVLNRNRLLGSVPVDKPPPRKERK